MISLNKNLDDYYPLYKKVIDIFSWIFPLLYFLIIFRVIPFPVDPNILGLFSPQNLSIFLGFLILGGLSGFVGDTVFQSKLFQYQFFHVKISKENILIKGVSYPIIIVIIILMIGFPLVAPSIPYLRPYLEQIKIWPEYIFATIFLAVFLDRWMGIFCTDINRRGGLAVFYFVFLVTSFAKFFVVNKPMINLLEFLPLAYLYIFDIVIYIHDRDNRK